MQLLKFVVLAAFFNLMIVMATVALSSRLDNQITLAQTNSPLTTPPSSLPSLTPTSNSTAHVEKPPLTKPSQPINSPTTNQITSINQPKVVPTVTQAPASETPDSAGTSVLHGGCLVQLYDGVYDLAQFRSIHSGGDIFQCNTDMTSVFSGQHSDAYLSQLAQYRVR